MMKTLTLILLISVAAFGQGVRVDPTPALTVSGHPPAGAFAPILAASGAKVAVCDYPNCAALSTTYTDAALGTPCPTTAQAVLAGTSTCTNSADERGNFGFWLATGGQYEYKITLRNGTVYGPYPITMQTNNSANVQYIAPGAGSVARTLADKNADIPLYVTDKGAKCDGTTDDYAAFAAALSSGATTIGIPPRTCKIDISARSGVIFPLLSSVRFIGASPTASIILATGAHSCAIRCTSYDTSLFVPHNNVDLGFENVAVQGPGNTIQTQAGGTITVGYQVTLIYPSGANSNVSLNGVSLSEASFAVKSDGGAGLNYWISNTDIGHFYSSAVGVFTSGGNISVTGNTTFHDIGMGTFNHGMYLNMPMASLTVTAGVTFQNVSGAGIQFYASHADGNGPVSVIGAKFLDCAWGLILSHTNPAYLADVKPAVIDSIQVVGGGILVDGPKISVTNSQFTYSSTNANAATTGITNGTFAVASDGMVIRGNRISGYPSKGIYRDVSGLLSKELAIESNSIFGTPTGMLLYNFTDSKIIGNLVAPNASGTGIQIAGATTDRVQVSRNTCVFATNTACLYLVGTLTSGLNIGGDGNDFSAGSQSVIAGVTSIGSWTNSKTKSGVLYPVGGALIKYHPGVHVADAVIASASTITIPFGVSVVHVSGTATINNINTADGVVYDGSLILIADGDWSLGMSGNIKGYALTASANRTIALTGDGTYWYQPTVSSESTWTPLIPDTLDYVNAVYSKKTFVLPATLLKFELYAAKTTTITCATYPVVILTDGSNTYASITFSSNQPWYSVNPLIQDIPAGTVMQLKVGTAEDTCGTKANYPQFNITYRN